MEKREYKSDRIPGIDLLRVILSFCVVIIHILHYGGFRTNAGPQDPEFYIFWVLGVMINCTVNCFAIISGFVLYSQETKRSNILRLLLTVLYHGIFITAAFRIFLPEAVADTNWIQAFLPISQEEFWYFTSYFGAFFFVPILIHGMRALPRKQADILVFSLVLIFSVVPVFSAGDPFDLNSGYSALWLLVMFVIGTYLKKYSGEFRIKKIALLGIFAGCVLITCLGMALSFVFPSVDGMQLMEYTSPTLVVAAITIVLLFIRVPVPAAVGKISSYCAPFVFSIYLLHEHPLIRENIIHDRFVFVLSLPAVLQIFVVFAIALGIWLICFVLDYIRQLVFRLLKVDRLLQRIENKLR